MTSAFGLTPDHSTCADTLRTMSADFGTEIIVSELPPIVRGPYTTDPYVCPHAQWVRDGVK